MYVQATLRFNITVLSYPFLTVPDPGEKDAWTLRNQKVSRIWKGLREEEKDVFRDPFFFALANLPDLSNGSGTYDQDIEREDGDEIDHTLHHINDPTATPSVHQLSNEEKLKYQHLFDELVDIDKLHLCHGKPAPSNSVATIQQQSLAELRKAHHAVSSLV